MKIDLGIIRIRVRREIDEYSYEIPSGAIGIPWSTDKVQSHFDELRNSLVDPYLATINMDQPFDSIGSAVYEQRICAIVADPKDGYLLFYDPLTDAFGVADRRDGGLFDVGIPGDAVGSFMAR